MPLPERRTYPHPVFGAIPLVPVFYADNLGRQHESLDFDPDYAPPLPPGAIRGDVRKQEYCRICHVPKYFYLDIARTCIQCGQAFVFRAAEQKLWYETLKFHLDSMATRCLACRRQRRSDRAIHRQLADAKVVVRQRPNDAAALLLLAEAIVRHVQRTEKGPLNEAIAASRKARRLLRDHGMHQAREALFWEGMCHALAGRIDAARDGLTEFLQSGPSGRQQLALAKEARTWLDRAAGAQG